MTRQKLPSYTGIRKEEYPKFGEEVKEKLMPGNK